MPTQREPDEEIGGNAEGGTGAEKQREQNLRTKEHHRLDFRERYTNELTDDEKVLKETE